jgi:hypothetical protein
VKTAVEIGLSTTVSKAELRYLKEYILKTWKRMGYTCEG